MHPSHRTAPGRPPLRVPLQQLPPLQEPVPGERVEGVGRPTTPYPVEQTVDEGEGADGIRALGPYAPAAAA